MKADGRRQTGTGKGGWRVRVWAYAPLAGLIAYWVGLNGLLGQWKNALVAFLLAVVLVGGMLVSGEGRGKEKRWARSKA